MATLYHKQVIGNTRYSNKKFCLGNCLPKVLVFFFLFLSWSKKHGAFCPNSMLPNHFFWLLEVDQLHKNKIQRKTKKNRRKISEFFSYFPARLISLMIHPWQQTRSEEKELCEISINIQALSVGAAVTTLKDLVYFIGPSWVSWKRWPIW